MKIFKSFLMGLALILGSQVWAFNAGQRLSVTLSKVNSNGTTTDLETTTVTADSSGKISFSFTAIPSTSDGINFLAITTKDSDGNVVRTGLIPAPASSATTLTGVNALSDVQARAILNGFRSCATDDPIYGAFGFVMLLSSTLTETDRNLISSGGCAVMRGSGGFEDYLQNTLGVSAAQMSTFKDKIVSNTASGKKSLPNFSSNFKEAVDQGDNDFLAKAGGLLADIFIDAANAVGFDPQLLTIALEAIGDKAETNADFLAVSSSAKKMMDQAIDSFFRRVKSLKTNTEYTDSLTALGATGDQVTRYNSAASAMLTCFQGIDTKYRQQYENQSIDTTLQSTIQAEYGTCYSTFKTAIQLTDAELTTLKSNMATALGTTVALLPAGYGTRTFREGTTVNISIPEALEQNFMVNLIANGGSLNYSARDTVSIPSLMTFLTSRTDYDTLYAVLSQSFKNFYKIREDVQIIQFTFFNTFSGGGRVSNATIQTAKRTFQNSITDLISRISGTTNGTTAITAAQAKALVKLALEPSPDC